MNKLSLVLLLVNLGVLTSLVTTLDENFADNDPDESIWSEYTSDQVSADQMPEVQSKRKYGDSLLTAWGRKRSGISNIDHVYPLPNEPYRLANIRKTNNKRKWGDSAITAWGKRTYKSPRKAYGLMNFEGEGIEF
ncbi:hypothetical protein HELRODRAFT_161008 [Helobdella robusta]|uniref:Uncharacterized protein n=1 Tax=Helobdella robusta TaxID=6412 RepID=T1ER02_HELRO|nr:hypothetical protein HELRODRAFT_161008 [Helobdella robusta]ESO01837.1 hypothetical protein HELRODRAFT_161008 [Helobdella robusta]